MAQKVYIGVPVTTVSGGTTVSITASNISTYFTVSNGSYYFAGSGSTFTTNNGGVKSSTATTTLTAKQAGTLSFNYSYSSEANYDKFTLKVAGVTIESAVSGATTNKSWSGAISVGDVIEFTYAKDSSQDANDDRCTFSGMQLLLTGTGTSSTKNNVAKLVNNIYIGVSGVARKVKKAYVGVGNVARLFWAKVALSATYDGYASFSDLTDAREYYALGTVGSYSIVAGGMGTSKTYLYSTTVNINANTLTTGTCSDLSTEVCLAVPCSMPTLFMVAGGVDYMSGASSTSIKNGSAFSSGLTRTTFSLSAKISESSATYVQSGSTYYGIFPLYAFEDMGVASSTVNAVSNSLSRSTLASLSQSPSGVYSTRTTSKALIADGAAINVYNSSLTKSTISGTGSCYCQGTTGNTALFNVNSATGRAINDSGVSTSFAGDTGVYWANEPQIPFSFAYNGLAVFISTTNSQFVAYSDSLVKLTCAEDGYFYSTCGGVTCIGNRVFQYRSDSTIRARYYTIST